MWIAAHGSWYTEPLSIYTLCCYTRESSRKKSRLFYFCLEIILSRYALAWVGLPYLSNQSCKYIENIAISLLILSPFKTKLNNRFTYFVYSIRIAPSIRNVFLWDSSAVCTRGSFLSSTQFVVSIVPSGALLHTWPDIVAVYEWNQS